MPSPGDLPNPVIETRSTALWADSLPAEPQGKPQSGSGFKKDLDHVSGGNRNMDTELGANQHMSMISSSNA